MLLALALTMVLAAPAAAKESSILTLAGPKEPGARLVVSGRIWQADGKRPATHERIGVYHADAKGEYGSKPGTPTMPGQTRDARLSGWLVTDAEGRYEVRTIRPGRYSGVPAHVHFLLGGSNLEVQFLDDDRVDATDRKNASKDGSFALVRPVTVDASGVQRVTKDFRLSH